MRNEELVMVKRLRLFGEGAESGRKGPKTAVVNNPL